MPTAEERTNRGPEFTSLFATFSALRREHTELLKATRSSQPDQLLRSRIEQFLARAVATGRILDNSGDRDAARGILDYWSATLLTDYSGMAPTASTPAAESEVSSVYLLADFDAATLDAIAESARAWLRTLSADDQTLVRRLLLRLMRLAPDRREFEVQPMTRDQLQAELGDPSRVDSLLATMEHARLLVITPGRTSAEDRVHLAFEALTRTWKDYAHWLNQRLAFRDTVRYWDAQGRDEGALIDAELLAEAEDFADKTGLESEFVGKSRERERRRSRNYHMLTFVFAGLALIALIAAGIATQQTFRAKEKERLATLAATEAKKQAGIADEQREKAERASEQTAQARDALHARQRIADMMALTRALAQIGTARSEPESQLATHQWEILSKTVAADDDFAKLLKQNRTDLEKVKRGDYAPADLERVKESALAAGRVLKAKSLELNDDILNQQLKDRRSISYGTVEFCVQRIVDCFADRPYVDAGPFIREFWILYWGELGLLEGPAVASAMKTFGDQLKAIDQLMDTHVPSELHERLKGLRWGKSEVTQYAQQIPFLMADSTLDEKLKMQLADLSKQTVPDAEVAELRNRMKSLVEALKSELATGLSQNQYLPKASCYTPCRGHEAIQVSCRTQGGENPREYPGPYRKVNLAVRRRTPVAAADFFLSPAAQNTIMGGTIQWRVSRPRIPRGRSPDTGRGTARSAEQMDTVWAAPGCQWTADGV